MRRASGVWTRAAKARIGFSVKDVPAQGCGHLQVVANQVEDEGGLVGVEFEPAEDAFGEARGFLRVAGFGAALAGVMQQRGEVEERRVGEVAEQAGELVGAQVGGLRGWFGAAMRGECR